MSGSIQTARERYGDFKAVLGVTKGQDMARALERFENHAANIASQDVAKKVLADMFDDEAFQAKFNTPRVQSEAPDWQAGNNTNMAIANLKQATDLHNRVTDAIHVVKMDYLGNFDEDSQELLKIENDTRVISAYSLRELAARATAVFGIHEEAELESIRRSLREPPQDQSAAIATHFTKFAKKLKTLKEHEREVHEADQKKEMIISVGGIDGKYSHALLLYSNMPKTEQTFDNLKKAIIKEQQRLLSQQTAQDTGFAAAAQATAGPAAPQAQAAALAAPPSAGGGAAAAGGGGGAGRGLGAGGRGAGQGGRGLAGRGGRGGRVRFNGAGVATSVQLDTHYCWSHGPNGGPQAHHSSACPDPQQGHNNAATAAAIQGGRTLFCHSAQRHLYPHP